MSTVMEEETKRWTAKRKAALVVEIIQANTTIAEASRAFDIAPSEIEDWVDEVPSVVQQPNERWSTDLCRVWAGRDGWASLAIVIDCCTR